MEIKKQPVLFKRIQQPSVVEQIIESLKQSLINGELKPGQRLPSEGEMVEQLGVGRSAVREAMKVMQALGVVNIRQGDGTYVVDKPSSSMLSPLVFAIMLESGITDELYELRALIEIGYCELVAEKATSEDWEAIEAAAKALEHYAVGGGCDVKTLVDLDLKFHFALLDATHNALVIKIGRTVEALFLRSMRDTYATRENNIQWAVDSHRAIMHAININSPADIRRAIERSLLYWNEEVSK